ncbi:MAG TPA: undecaprenyl-diphosphate phosphatase [Woeseiaceae bacterium]|nr:undecaprenyl-diphosphate phosphatase [Woeseiaceae bacterium]
MHIIVLAVVQGLTEFLPISSSGHLILVPSFFGWADQGLIFDVAVHFGTLGAVCVYFRRDIAGLLYGARRVLGGDVSSPRARLALALLIGTLPAAVAGLLFAGWIEENLRQPEVVVLTLSSFGILMALADRLGRRTRAMADVTLKDALLIGMAQALALVPGTSRSGVTITAAMALGLERHDAARFSFLLSAPVILLACGYKVLSLVLAGAAVAWNELAIGALVSGIVAYLSIEFFMRFVNAIGLLPFALYRLALAAVILVVLV